MAGVEHGCTVLVVVRLCLLQGWALSWFGLDYAGVNCTTLLQFMSRNQLASARSFGCRVCFTCADWTHSWAGPPLPGRLQSPVDVCKDAVTSQVT